MIKKAILTLLFSFAVLSCSSGVLKYDKAKEEFKSEEFEKQVKIVESDPDPEGAKTETAPVVKNETKVKAAKKKVAKKSNKSKKAIKSKKAAAQVKTPVEVLTRQPDIEDSEGFNNQRRPPVDPFKVGENVVHEVSYLGASAGKLTLSVGPFAMVNGKKAYNFLIDIKSSSFFSSVYAVDDRVQTYVDYDALVPGAFKLDIKDSGQVKEAKSYFDFDSLKASYWEHRYTEKGGHEEKKLNWSILPYSQNPFSAIFYMRVFKWTVGKDYVFRVADDEKNVTFAAKALEKTKLSTDAGDFNAIKIKAEVVSRGNLSKARDFYMWLSDDDHHYVLRIEVKLPIGSLVSEIVELKEGK
jgi:hypothetical protein